MAQTTVDTLLIKIEADMKSLKREMDKVKKTTQQTSQGVGKGFDGINRKLRETSKTARNVGLAIGTAFAGIAIKKIINTGQSIESLQIRLKALFGSAEEGAKAFDQMAKFAAKVPFSLQEIQTGSGALAAVADNAEHLGEILTITGNVAAITGLDFATASMQIQRSFSAGIGAADLFRERAVRSLLGFQAGVDVSVEETIAKFKEKFGKGGEFGETTNELANTLSGTLSMIGDKVFSFQRLIADEGFFNEVKGQFKELDKFLAENGESIDELAKDISKGLVAALTGLVKALKVVADNTKTFESALASLLVVFVSLKAIKVVTALVHGFTGAVALATGGVAALTATMKKNLLFFGISSAIVGLTLLIEKFDVLDKVLGRVSDKVSDPRLQSFGAIGTNMTGGPDFSKKGQIAAGKPKIDRSGKVKPPQAFTEAMKDLEEEIQLAKIQNDNQREFQELLMETKITDEEYIQQLREKFDTLKEIEVAQKTQNDLLTDAESIIEGNKTEQEKLNEQIQLFEESLNSVSDVAIKEKMVEALGIMKEELRQLDPLMQEITQIFDRASASISQAIADSITDGKNLMESLGNITKQVVNQMIAEFLRLKVIGPLMSNIFGGAMGGMGGSRGRGGGGFSFSSLLGPLFSLGGLALAPVTGGASVPIGAMAGGSIAGSMAGNASMINVGGGAFNTAGGGMAGFAGGGTIAPNRAVMVGERGPEIFVPNSGGRIVPNHNMKALGGQETVINQNINITTGVSQTVRAEVLNMLPAIKQETLQAVADSRLRGGTFGAAFTR